MNDKLDLMYAVLAMDSYNRGYNAGINDLLDSIGTGQPRSPSSWMMVACSNLY